MQNVNEREFSDFGFLYRVGELTLKNILLLPILMIIIEATIILC